MSAQGITLKIKKTACPICKNADKRALRKRWPYCKAKNPRNRNGHCTEFIGTKPRRSDLAEMEAIV